MTALPNCKKKRRNTHLNSNRDIFFNSYPWTHCMRGTRTEKRELSHFKDKNTFLQEWVARNRKSVIFPGDDGRCVTLKKRTIFVLLLSCEENSLVLPSEYNISRSAKVAKCRDAPSHSPLSLCKRVLTDSFPTLPWRKYSSWFCLPATAMLFLNTRLYREFYD